MSVMIARPAELHSASVVAPKYVSQHTVEALYGLTSRQYRDLVRRESLPCIRTGRLVLVEASVLDSWLADHTDQPAQPDPDSLEAIRKRCGVRRLAP
jgi:hypothetical protein